MKSIAITRVRNELDIIEAFVRHHAHHFEKLIILDDGSSDGTYEVLLALQTAGLPLVVMREASVGRAETRYMPRLLRMAVDQFGADWIIPLDADEFVELDEVTSLTQVLHSRESELLRLRRSIFIWRLEDDENMEPNPVLRQRFRMPTSPPHLDKVLLPAKFVVDGIAELTDSRQLLCEGDVIGAQPLNGVSLCHFPIRSVAQYASKVAIEYLHYSTTADWDRIKGGQYVEPFRLLALGINQLAHSMPAHSRRYGLEESWPAQGEPKEAPLRYQGGSLSFTTNRKVVLTNVLRCAEAIATELAECRRQKHELGQRFLAAKGVLADAASRVIAQDATRFVALDMPATAEPDCPNIRAHAQVPKSAMASSQVEARHRFQSFWSGGNLSPYEAFCLKSFIDCGHAFDLYTFETNIVAPQGVRICDAAHIIDQKELFVYKEGFGKGSPSAFSNLFRYKLLAERGGWWVDTDIVCLSEDIPTFSEFFAREDANQINGAVLFFEPRHPLMLQCLEEAMRLGRSVRWGDAGPRLLTRTIEKLGYDYRAVSNSLCYPVHHSEVLDILRPSKSIQLTRRTSTSIFVHLWNEMLRHNGVHKTYLPPKGSMLRRWVERYPVDGWRGEYDHETLETALILYQGFHARSAERAQLESLLHSTSWQLTKPLRTIARNWPGLLMRFRSCRQRMR
jgi:hypothetical protein